jgi:hypothetical protein
MMKAGGTRSGNVDPSKFMIRYSTFDRFEPESWLVPPLPPGGWSGTREASLSRLTWLPCSATMPTTTRSNPGRAVNAPPANPIGEVEGERAS